MNTIETNRTYKLIRAVKGWPVEDSTTLDEAAKMILGSPYWDIPEDCYRVIDKNDTYCLLAVYRKGHTNPKNHYLAVIHKIEDIVFPSCEE